MIPFDETNEEHSNLLKKLWASVFPDKPWEGFVGDHWKTMGFQGKNPKTDFRAMGIMGLKHLLYFAETHPDTLRRMVNGQIARHSGDSTATCFEVLLYSKRKHTQLPLLALPSRRC